MRDSSGDPGASHDDKAVLGDLAQVTDQASLGVIRFDRKLRVLAANGVAHQLAEWRRGSLIGRSVLETFVDHQIEQLVRDAAAGRTGERASVSTDGISIVVRASPAAEGGAWVTLQNTTELERLRRMRTEFIDNLSHELRTPLTNVRLLTELLIDELAGADVSERIRERVATIDVETGHMVQMISELLELSRIEQVATTIRQDEVEFDVLAVETARRLDAFADRQRVTIEVQVSPELPAVRGDEERLGQLLMNLMHNAIKFSPQGGSVRVVAEVQEDAVLVSVADEGVGVPVQDQDRIFERFYKVDRARQRGLGGTGLGLAIARHISELHGGRIWVESTEGHGSTFRFSLPLAQPSESRSGGTSQRS